MEDARGKDEEGDGEGEEDDGAGEDEKLLCGVQGDEEGCAAVVEGLRRLEGREGKVGELGADIERRGVGGGARVGC